MSAWTTGAADVERMLTAAKPGLQRVPGAQLSVAASLARARQLLVSAGTLLDADPDTAFVLAYDAARQAGVAVLAQQGLRATQEGGHMAVERTLRAQFSPGFAEFGNLRRRRHELEYPGAAGPESTSAEEARQALVDAADIVDKAATLLPALDLF